MRINEPPPINVSRGESAGPIAAVVPAGAVNPVASGSYQGGRVVGEPGENPAPSAQPAADRRARLRRAGDRRQQQAPVTIDTRVSQRRTMKRRAADQPPQAVNVQV